MNINEIEEGQTYAGKGGTREIIFITVNRYCFATSRVCFVGSRWPKKQTVSLEAFADWARCKVTP